jgi:hypothetical protein
VEVLEHSLLDMEIAHTLPFPSIVAVMMTSEPTVGFKAFQDPPSLIHSKVGPSLPSTICDHHLSTT